ncbi:DUF3179 domain-containing protein [Megalodesulfovibrio paquesii]
MAYEKTTLVMPPPPGMLTPERLDTMASRILDTGVARDAIPPIDRPEFMSITDANLVMDAGDPVFLLEDASPPRIYPQMTLVWHAVVNEVEGTGPASVRRSVTYCPLTGSVVAYSGTVGSTVTTFGTAGPLLENNTLLYDRATGSLWTQLAGLCVKGPLKGARLSPTPLLWTTYGRAAARYPNALVLSKATGFRRDYSKDPYGSYTRNGTYYDNNVLVHPVSTLDRQQPLKEKVLGLILPDMLVAVVKNSLRHAGAANFDAGSFPIVALWDESLHATRLFDRRVNGQPLAFAKLPQGIYDSTTRTRWSPTGEGLEGPLAGSRLTRLPSFTAMWYAWAAFFPETKLYNWTPELERESMRSFPDAIPPRLEALLRNPPADNATANSTANATAGPTTN